MILSYRDKRTREFAEGRRVREFDGFRRQAEKRLDILDAATSLADLRALPSNALEMLKGDRKGVRTKTWTTFRGSSCIHTRIGSEL